MYGDIQPFRLEALRQRNAVAFGQVYVKDLITTVAIKMAMFPHIRAKSRRSPLQGNLPHQAAFDQGSQAIIYRGNRNIGHRLLGANENFLSRRVVALTQ